MRHAQRLFRRSNPIGAAVLTLGLVAGPGLAQQQVDERLPEYRPVQGVSGTIKSIGSDTLNNLMTLWAEKFQEHYPNVKIEIEGKGSSTAPPALIAGSAGFGPMSRPMKDKEIDEFEKRYGYEPVALRTVTPTRFHPFPRYPESRTLNPGIAGLICVGRCPCPALSRSVPPTPAVDTIAQF